ncbi:MAG: branched-chain amino acid ABC transporter permease [Anaerolineales bacterium]|nr:MAG: branched-chain amino acid ABC transporter permease [Chloroflexota bacterium]MBE7434908.1 branched-chain amino acid ABC transporter permease [Anaerolineales bacterium]MCE7859210.1 branched-chain amino acid ABC transporter permease [Chloroflexi bacterium CFX2]
MWGFRILIVSVILFGTISTILAGKYTSEQWIDFVVQGISQGSLYALIALGYTMVYGILRMINFAHGDIFMTGAFGAYFIATWLNNIGFIDGNPLLGFLIPILFAMLVSTSIAMLVERIAYRPLRGAPRLVPLISAIGASFFLEYAFRGFFGPGVYAYPPIKALDGDWVIFGVGIQKVQIVVAVAAAAMMAILYSIVMFTKTGKAMRAVSENKDTAALMGIDVNRIIVSTFAIGAAMAGAAGVLNSLMFRQVNFFIGFVPGIKAFTAAVLGGIGNIPGAMVGGLVLGIFESVGPSLFLEGLGIPRPYQLKDAIAYTMLVMILLFRPSGILGERLSSKKA